MKTETLYGPDDSIPSHPVVSHDEWLSARKELFRREKELTRLGDEVSAARRALPWEKVEKNYLLEGPQGEITLAGLFGGKRRLK